MGLIDRQAASRALAVLCINCDANGQHDEGTGVGMAKEVIEALPSAEPEIIRCKDCFYGYLYSGVYAGTTCSWVECKNPDGLNRDVSLDGYCSAAVRRKDDE